MKRKKNIIGVAVFVSALIGFMVYHNVKKPRLLILHSYDESYPWVRDINIGLRRVLKKSEDRYFIRWYYLDTKRHPRIEYKKQIGSRACWMIDDWRPHVIIAMDDDAQEYVAKYYKNVSWVSIVFGGVNNTLETYGYDKTNNVTGILERLPLDAVKEGLETFSANRENKQPLRVFFVGDQSETVKGDERWVRKFSWEPLQLIGTKLVNNLDDWKEAIQHAAQSSDYILTSNYREIHRIAGKETLVPPRELINMSISITKIPIIGTNAFFSEDGGILAIATSPMEQGMTTASMAVEILEKQSTANEIPIVTSSHAVVAMRDQELKQIGFKIPKMYEAYARATNYYYK